MINKCGNCENQYTWDCPRVETFAEDEDVCASYKSIVGLHDDDHCFDCQRFFECNGSCGEL